MRGKKRLIKYSIFFSILLLLVVSIAILVVAKKGGGGGVPCDGPLYAAGLSYERGACVTECGSPSECNRVHPGGKGPGCEIGQVCGNDCYCKWVDKDLDGYATESCGENVGRSGWVSDFGEADIISGEKQEWILSTAIAAQSFRIIQTRGLGHTKVFSVEIHDKDGNVQTYDYTQEDLGYFELLKTRKLLESFNDLIGVVVAIIILGNNEVEVKKVVVDWDDLGESNKARLELFVGLGSPTCDCDDDNPYIHPGAEELCDNADNDCDGEVDEGEVCEKHIYLCKTDNFEIQYEGLGRDISYGYCADGTWCSEGMVGESGSCSYETEEDDIGQNEFFTYICDINTCYKFTEGNFMVCGYGWSCEAMCVPGECNYATEEWCNVGGIWQTEGWCHSECGKRDSECGGNCKQDSCDIDARKWCNNGYWVDENYCDCEVCGSKDSTCTRGCSCEEGDCDTINDAICEDGFWESGESYCWTTCCQEDYNCYTADICETCVSGTCDTTNNQYCLGGAWISDGYCELYCEEYDYDCGAEPCEHGNCDIIAKMYCLNGVWVDPKESYCNPGYCGTADATCECSYEKDDCCKAVEDEECDPDCLEGDDIDCGECTSAEDCCDDTPGNGCDEDCIPGVDPDCQDDCSIEADYCCSDTADGNCDPDCTENSDIDCAGICTSDGGDCCAHEDDGVCDPDCIIGVDPNCAAHPCKEDWECEEWDEDCDGINGNHACLEWVDNNDCNTVYDKPSNTQPCYIEFPCVEGDDKDEDGYPKRACYDEENEIVLDEVDCDDTDSSQHPGAEEICNGEDDNCDDSEDEGCPCVEGGDPNICGKNEGICREGRQICEAGMWGICGGPGYVGPKKEACDDGIDNNCDGYIDENCECTEGDKQDCGEDEGVCEEGWQACYEGGIWSICNDEEKGTTEVCDNELDDDCDGSIDGDDSNCQVTTPVTTGPNHCKNRKQDGDEEGLDCGGKDCPSCAEKPQACDYGKIVEKCVCGKAAYRTGFCCNGKYSLVACKEPRKDSDNDGCYDDEELKAGTDVYMGDTDGDGLLDCDVDEMYPLCNEDGVCDSEQDYPETLQNCSTDCEEKGTGLLIWIILAIILLALAGAGGYLYAKKKGYKLSDFIKIKGKKKEEKPKFQFIAPGKVQKKSLPSKQPTAEKPVIEEKPITPTKPKKKTMIQLKAFVNNSLRKGYTKLQIRQIAMKEGWTKEEIDKALKGKKSQYKLFK